MKCFTNKESNVPYALNEVPFNSSADFMLNYLDDGDYFIPFNGTLTSSSSKQPDMDPKIYDPCCIKVFRRSNNSAALKNIRSKIEVDSNGSIKNVKRIYDKFVHISENKLFSGVIKSIKTAVAPNLNKFPSIFLWIPLWSPVNKTATMISLFNRIYLLFT